MRSVYSVRAWLRCAVVTIAFSAAGFLLAANFTTDFDYSASVPVAGATLAGLLGAAISARKFND